jgi:hypothetical protein
MSDVLILVIVAVSFVALFGLIAVCELVRR